MHPDFTNLLPEDRLRLLTHEYWLRLAVLAAWMAIGLIVVNALLLIPSYDLVESQITAREGELAALTTAAAASGASTFTTQLAAFTRQANALAALGSARYGVPILAQVLAIAHPGVSITGLALGTAGSVSVSGTALTRDSLRAYDLALSAAPFAAAVNLPVSDYAAESNLSFTITITLVSP